MKVELRKESELKDSGIEWIGKIPEGWKIMRVDSVADIIPGFPFDSDLFDKERGKPLIRIRDILTKTTVVGFTGEYDSQYLVKNGNLIVGMDGDFICSDWTGEEALLNQRLCKIGSREPTLSILRYSLNFPLKLINDVTMFTTVKHLSESQIRRIRIPLGNTDDPRIITSYLDSKTSKLQSLIDSKTKQIELLKEQEKSLIHHAVTKGLDPNVKLKDSGVEWIGEIPEGWKITRIKNVANYLIGGTPPRAKMEYFDGDNLWVSIADLNDKPIITETHEKITKNAVEISNCKLVPKGSLLYSFKLTLGLTAFAGSDLYTNEAIASFLIDSKINLNYLKYVLVDGFENNARENIYSAKLFNQRTIENALIVSPPNELQEKIAQYLDSQTSKLHKAIKNLQTEIAKLEEYKKSMIYEVVTGKVKVN